jgi:UDP-4-keto-D-FucNAc 4-reductase
VASSTELSSNIAVTGASGFVGGRLLARLVADGHQAVAISRRPLGLTDVREVTVLDYSDTARLADSLKGVEVLIHLAARAHFDHSEENEAMLFRKANVDTTQFVAKACIEAGVKRFVLVSSIGVNGNHTCGKPFTEEDTPRPVEPYAVSKWDAERALAELLDRSSPEYVIVRPPLVYGPACPGNFRRLVALVASSPIIPLGALRAPRSFIYVENLVDALLVAGHHPGAASGTFLLSDGSETSVSEVVSHLAREMRPGKSVVWNVPQWLLAFLAKLAGRSEAFEKLAWPLQVDASAFSRVTGWRAPFSLEQGLLTTARAYTAVGMGLDRPAAA